MLTKLNTEPFIKGVWRIMRSQGIQGIAGLIAIPIIVHGLGTHSYGQFSIAMMLAGGLQSFDLALNLLIPYLANSAANSDYDSRPIWQTLAFNLLFLSVIALALGIIFLHAPLVFEIVAFAISYAITTAIYCLLAANGKAAGAMATRNIVWAGAFLVAALLAHMIHSPAFCFVPFIVANVVILVIYRMRWPISMRPLLMGGPIKRIRWRDIREVIGTVGSKTFLAFSDRGILSKYATPVQFGTYATQVDLVLKVNLIGTAISRILYPHLADIYVKHGEQQAADRLARVYLLAIPFLALIALGIQFVGPALFRTFFTSSDFHPAQLLPLFGAGVFLQFSGFLLVPWYNVAEKFYISRTMFGIGLLIVIGCGPLLIGWYGVLGAAWLFMIARLPQIGLTVWRAIEAKEKGEAWVPFGMGLMLMATVTTIGIFLSYNYV